MVTTEGKPSVLLRAYQSKKERKVIFGVLSFVKT